MTLAAPVSVEPPLAREDADAPDGWALARDGLSLFAVDPAGLGGVRLRAHAGPARTLWLDRLRAALPDGSPIRRVPLNVTDSRLLGGLDLAATLRAGRPVAERGLLSDLHDGVAVLPMAERVEPSTAARIAMALDLHAVSVERDGFTFESPTRFGVVALDEGIGDEERIPHVLADRLAFDLGLEGLRSDASPENWPAAARVAGARARLAVIELPEPVLRVLCQVALALGVGSVRLSLLAARAARASAALAARETVEEQDAALAARLVLAPRATQLPAPPETPAEETAPRPEPPETPEAQSDTERSVEEALNDLVLEAAEAAIPPGLLERLRFAAGTKAGGRGGPARVTNRPGARGRPTGVFRGDPRPGVRLNLVETLRAAAPWQRLRGGMAGGGRRIQVRREDFRLSRIKHRTETTTIFVVDASGSAALHRLAEAKGAVELMLAECYIRRDEVALLSFRGQGAELVLPPTRSLVRAKRGLAALPGGGGTPLAVALDNAALLAAAVRSKGREACLVLLTDGKANIARDGTADRARARDDALGAARALRAAGIAGVVVDTAPRPQEAARGLAQAMDAVYLALPRADARAISTAARAALA